MTDPIQSLAQIGRRLSVRHALPSLIFAFLLAGVALAALATRADVSMRSVVFALACTILVFAMGILTYVIGRKPELLRSEDHQMVGSYLDWLQTVDVDDEIKVKAADKPIEALLRNPGETKRQARLSEEDSSG